MAVVKYRMPDGSYAPISFPGTTEINQQLIRKYSLDNNVLSLKNNEEEILLTIDLSSLEQEIPNASSSANGLMLASDKVKLDGIPVSTSADAGKFLRVAADGSYVLETIPNAEETAF